MNNLTLLGELLSEDEDASITLGIAHLPHVLSHSAVEATPSDNARETPRYQSFFMGGFECATHRRRDRRRLDVVSRTGHDLRCAEDYNLLAQAVFEQCAMACAGT